MGTHLRVLSESYLVNINMPGLGLDGYQKTLNPFALDVSSLSIGRVKIHGSYSTSCLGSVYF